MPLCRSRLGLGPFRVWLFDLERDPNEEANVANSSNAHRATVASMRKRLAELERADTGYKTPQINLPRVRGMPVFHNDTWAPFLKSGEAVEEAGEALSILNPLDLD